MSMMVVVVRRQDSVGGFYDLRIARWNVYWVIEYLLLPSLIIFMNLFIIDLIENVLDNSTKISFHLFMQIFK